MSDAKHTPLSLPLTMTKSKIDMGSYVIRGKNGDLLCRIIGIADTSKEIGNAIVRACNSHDALVYDLNQLVAMSRSINDSQHAGTPIHPNDWSNLYQLTNKAMATLADVTK